jgi:EAL domain-containing protein (putative c-di-GMP-specific phosphodiesterase class I)
LIKKVGHKLASMVRSRDVVARIGSDKFGVLLENCDLATAQIVMKKIAHAVSTIELEWEGESHQVSVSIGIAPITAQAQSVTSLLNASETARNVSKERGRNTIHVLDMDDSNLLQRKEQIRWVSQIQSALRDDRFLLYAQLIEPLKKKNGKPHYEILLRLQDDDGSIILPGKFLPAAENFYLMSSIDYWVIDRTFSELAQFRQGSEKLSGVSINLSGQSLGDPTGLAAYIENKLEHYQLDAQDICFEITESTAIANIDDARVFIDQLSARGFEFSLDDFGTGLSSFAYLKNLQVNYLKIDGSFVSDIVQDPVCASMVGAINQVGHAMQLKTVAEFVENDAIKRKLIEIGVDFGQGYGLGMPQPLADIFSDQARAASKSA